MEELNLCPVCGSGSAFVEQEDVFYVTCPDCGTMGPHAQTKQEAVYAWNAANPDDLGCPFCGGRIRTFSVDKVTIAECTQCRASGPAVGGDDTKAALLARDVFIYGTEAVEGR